LKQSAYSLHALEDDSPIVKLLAQLLRIALGKEGRSTISKCVNWEEVYDLSLKQGVGAMACDGLLSLEECDIDEVLKYKWMGQSMVIEKKANDQWNLLCRLANLYTQNGIKTYVLKGFSYASYYPNPFHRTSSDLDICLLDAYERGNQIVEKTGVKVDRDDSKHSHFTINNIHIENHKYCVGLRGNSRNKRIEACLRGLLEEEVGFIGECKALRPCWLFNALFFICHAKHHFLIEEGITLKYVCDWIVLRDSKEAALDKQRFWQECERLGLMKFATAIDEVADYMTEGKSMGENGNRMLQDILSVEQPKISQHKVIAHLGMLKTIWSNRWKYKQFSDTTAVKMMGTYIYGYLFDRNPNL